MLGHLPEPLSLPTSAHCQVTASLYGDIVTQINLLPTHWAVLNLRFILTIRRHSSLRHVVINKSWYGMTSETAFHPTPIGHLTQCLLIGC